ncbi:hypothetical protein [Halobacillus yeomjeoni]|nr:hypothetical protein [Halobacillus yeomjeoni]
MKVHRETPEGVSLRRLTVPHGKRVILKGHNKQIPERKELI